MLLFDVIYVSYINVHIYIYSYIHTYIYIHIHGFDDDLVSCNGCHAFLMSPTCLEHIYISSSHELVDEKMKKRGKQGYV